ncbi:MAG: hypothetical protein JOY93_05905, partial [Acidobacteriales bacterium]|nr:hypothetical protein [Terriglobales bacterium]
MTATFMSHTRRLISCLDPHKAVISQPEIDAMDRKLLLYSEHTFGYSKTKWPSLLGEEVFARKSKVAVDADEMTGLAVNRLLKPRGQGSFTADQPFEYTVLNPYSFSKHELAPLPVNFWEAPFLKGGVSVIGPGGEQVPFQVDQSARGWNVFVPAQIKPRETARYRLISDRTHEQSDWTPGNFYELAWTPERGITSFKDQETGHQLLNPERGGLGCPVYQIFPDAD